MQHDLLLSAGRTAHLRLSDIALTIGFGLDLVYTLDLSGRLIGVYRQGVNMRRGLDGRVLARWRDESGTRRRVWLDQAAIAQELAALKADIELIAKAQPPMAMAVVLCHARYFDYAIDIAQFHQVYRPISILPPDQYQALVLQATEGCSFNTCTFCALYRDRPFRIKRPQEFALHIEEVRDFLGPGIVMRRSIFLADANALIVPQARLLPLFDEVAQAFAIMPEQTPARKRRAWLRTHPEGVTGIYSFVDGLSAERKSVEDLHALRLRGLRRVYIGLESGNEALLAWLRKPSTAAAMLDAVRRMKTAGLQIGVIVLTGIGGRRFHEGHCSDTAEILNAMPLAGSDIIYFSPFRPDPAAPYEAIAAAAGIEPPTPELARAQEQAIRTRLTLPPPPLGPKRVPYNLNDFVY
jgi:hypothetical protein